MKVNPRVLGIDDAPFHRGMDRVPLAGVVVRAPMYLERVMRATVARDGTDATEAILGMAVPGVKDNVAAILVDGICVAGFNPVDIRALNARSGLPVITVTRSEPDPGAMEAALRAHFSDWQERLALITASIPIPIDAGGATLIAGLAGCEPKWAARLLSRFMVQGSVPEPLRMAHLIARGGMDLRNARCDG